MGGLQRFLAERLSGRPLCKNHPSAVASTTCARCLLPVCEVCALSDGKGAFLCPECLRGRRTTRIAVLATGAVAVTAAAIAAVVWIRRPREEPAPAPARPPTLEEASAKEPCDRTKANELVMHLIKVGDNRGAVDRGEAFLAKCGDDKKIRAWVYTAHSNLSEWDAAVADASKLIEADPNVARYWTFRGMAYEGKEDLPAAAADFRQAMAIQPDITLTPFNLARAYERMGTPCEAIGPIEQFLHYHPTSRDEATTARLSRLYATDGCTDMAGSGHATIHFAPGTNVIRTTVDIDGHAGTFVVDTGASTVVVSAQFAKQMGLAYEGWPAILIATAGGVRKARHDAFGRVTVQGVRTSHVEGVVADEMSGMQGLLGVSFLSRFTVHMDPQKGVLEISARAPAAKGNAGSK